MIAPATSGGWRGTITSPLGPQPHPPGTPACHPNDACTPAIQTAPTAFKASDSEYIELHAASAFSFLDGASQPEGLIERAAELGMPTMALADRNGVYGA